MISNRYFLGPTSLSRGSHFLFQYKQQKERREKEDCG
uniref:Uncharacterized protein n=1 Tax=Rhizophora mucronata TaxID=61149 RepID=A0A2P2NRN6_RHIMU